MNARFQLIPVILVSLFTLTSVANAQIAVGAHGGIAFSDADLFVGANATIPLGFQVGEQNLIANPEASYWITGEGYSLFIISANVLYPFSAGSINAYGGGGILISFVSVNTHSSTDFGLNAKGGAEFGEGKLKPFAEAGFFIKDGGFLYGQGGVRIQLGD